MKYFLLTPFLVMMISAHAQTRIEAQTDSLNKEARSFLNASKFAEALQVALTAKTLAAEHLGESHPSFIAGCNLEANACWRLGNYDQAVKACREGMDQELKARGKATAEYAGLLHMLATLELEMAHYQQAELDFIECLDLREKIFGKNSAEYAMSLNNLGNLYSNQGQLDKALLCHQEAKQIREAVLGKESSGYAMSLGNLGMLSFRMGAYEKSLAYTAESAAIMENAFGKGHPFVSIGAHNMAITHTALGQYRQAELKFKEALEMVAATQGAEHPQYAFILNDLGSFYDQLGQTEKALDYFNRSLLLKEKSLGKEHNYTLVTLGNMAKVYQESGRHEEAASIYLDLGETYRKNYGFDHIENLVYQNNLANIYIETGDCGKADSLHREILRIRQTKLGKDHPDCAQSLIGLANSLRCAGALEASKATAKEALELLTSAFGENHLLAAINHQLLAELGWELGQSDYSLSQANHTNDILRSLLVNSAKHLSSNELQLNLLNHQKRFDFIQSTRLRYGLDQKDQIGQAFDDAVFFKGMLLENAIQLEKTMAHAPDSLKQVYLNWKALQRRLGDAYAQPGFEQAAIKDLEGRAEDLEKELLRHSTIRLGGDRTSWSEIRNRLQEGEAAIEFVHFSWNNPRSTDSVLYVALMLRSEWEAPAWITLFEEKQVLSFIEAENSRGAKYVEDLFDPDAETSLYNIIWQPLEQYLEGVDRIYFSPSGILHRIPLAALENEAGQLIGDRFVLHQMGSTRQLKHSDQNDPNSSRDALIFGGIQYDMDSSAVVASNDALSISAHDEENLLFDATRSLLQGGKPWKYLPWTEVEAKMLNVLFKKEKINTKLFLAYEATEETFRNIGKEQGPPRVLHIATHGYFFPDPAPADSGVNLDPVFKISAHPMIRSGLILAGANRVWTGGQAIEGREDGILTAYEISQMNLAGTELAVLSACETGLGDIEGNEGVFGLQRAFKMAGVRYLIMSLWQVPDFVTQQLMTAFYQNWLIEEMTIPEAFRKARQQIRKEKPEAFYWAGFILVE